MLKNRELESEMNRVAAMASARIYDAMEVAGLSRSELADRIGVHKSRVSKVLEGDANLTLKTMVQFGLGCGVYWDLQPMSLGTVEIHPKLSASPIASAPELSGAEAPTLAPC